MKIILDFIFNMLVILFFFNYLFTNRNLLSSSLLRIMLSSHYVHISGGFFITQLLSTQYSATQYATGKNVKLHQKVQKDGRFHQKILKKIRFLQKIAEIGKFYQKIPPKNPRISPKDLGKKNPSKSLKNWLISSKDRDKTSDLIKTYRKKQIFVKGLQKSCRFHFKKLPVLSKGAKKWLLTSKDCKNNQFHQKMSNFVERSQKSDKFCWKIAVKR